MEGREVVRAFVLAGGQSRRMGQDKALMQFAGKSLVVRAAEILAPFVSAISLLGPGGRYENLGLPVIEDKWPGEGPLAAICTGLLSSSAEWNIFLACDLPRVSPPFIELLVQRMRTADADAVVPHTADSWQPLAAAYHSRCRTAFARAIEAGERSIIRTFEAIRVEAITRAEMAAAGLSELELDNVNTPEDWERFRDFTNAG